MFPQATASFTEEEQDKLWDELITLKEHHGLSKNKNPEPLVFLCSEIRNEARLLVTESRKRIIHAFVLVNAIDQLINCFPSDCREQFRLYLETNKLLTVEVKKQPTAIKSKLPPLSQCLSEYEKKPRPGKAQPHFFTPDPTLSLSADKKQSYLNKPAWSEENSPFVEQGGFAMWNGPKN